MTDNGYSRRHGKRILICVRGVCAPPEEGAKLEQRLLQLIQAHGLDNPEHPQHARCTVTQCLAVCQDGPIMMVHPDGIRYCHVDEAALERIFEEHILHNRPVEALVYDDPLSRLALQGITRQRNTRPRRRNREW